ncbi:hypothetical protein M0R04_16055 [Candidatus Dojkabacteria bacterium]|jgi:hypothetical protein|nr:hypothetical protein [Candidatus Dojkabacteria bacterium]
MEIVIGYEIVRSNFKHHFRKTFRPIYKDLGKGFPPDKVVFIKDKNK